MPLTLIQLISEQTMQNLLPVLRLKPARLVHLVTAKTAARSAFIVEAARQAGLQPAVELVTLSAMPAMPETFNIIKSAILEARSKTETPLVNFTGGTKLMSIGAFSAALNQKALSLYVDTEGALFVDGRTAEGLAALLEDDFTFTPLRTALTVNTLAVAHGRQRVTGGRDWRPFLPLAEHLVANPDEEQATHAAITKDLLAGKPEPRKPADWLPILAKPVGLPAEVAGLAIGAGLLQNDSSGQVTLPRATEAELQRLANNYVPDFNAAYFRAVSPLQQALGFLTGGWWEVVVAAAAERSGMFRDIRWSAQVGSRAGADLEEDVLALDGVQIVSICCKRGGAKARLLPLLEEMNARARSMGGNFTRRFLAIYLPLSGAVARNLERRANELGVVLLNSQNLEHSEVFSQFRRA
ncbi:MAG: DUF1887 family CARF protein [Verrucomicrobiales bacterium]|nr:DUF1887 family CARF protein [Verrucomicrobiales bacterium]